MATLESKLQSTKNQVSILEYELSDEVMNKKIALSDELYDLLDSYDGAINIADKEIMVEGDYYDKHTEIFIENYRRPIEMVYGCKDGASYVDDEDGEEFYFMEDLTLSEIEEIVLAVKETIEDDQVL
jgi:hypothetical protein